MSGKIEVKTRKGSSLDIRYNFYPEAYWSVTGECGTQVIISPRYSEICRLLIDMRKHELKVDRTRKRKSYTSKLINQLEETVKILKQTKLSETEKIEEIYLEQEMINNVSRDK